MPSEPAATLLITCRDGPGIVAAVSSFLHRHGANITDLDQHSTDPEGGTFFMRLEFQTPRLDTSLDRLADALSREVGAPFGMEWRLSDPRHLKRIALLVSRHDHALLELLWLWRRGELPADIALVVSNHPDLRSAVEGFGIPFHHVPVAPDGKAAAEERILQLIGNVDLVVLARYMQILSGDFVGCFPERIINIHHSFLPAFVGADPYRQAYQRGVKIVGATAHYVIESLDAGPIIEQDVVRVSHRDPVEEIQSLGRDLERRVLARAVTWHLEDRILVHGNKTVVFR